MSADASGARNARAWGGPSVLDYFAKRRATSGEVYPSEWFFLKDRLREGMSVLDVGCAQGGFVDIIAEHVRDFSYTGLDISAEMIAAARERHPGSTFHHVAETDYAVLGAAQFDLVLVLGILHLHEAWRATLSGAWTRTKGSLVFDLRIVDGPTIEDRVRSYMKMDFSDSSAAAGPKVPYNLINAGEAQGFIAGLCREARSLAQYGYRHPISSTAVTPVAEVMAIVWCAER